MLDKTYWPADVEQRIYQSWDNAGAFAPGRRGNATPYTIVIPPPNVTGSLHMGHALNSTIQDVLIRYRPHGEGGTPFGNRAWTTPASPPRWWSSAIWRPRASRATIWGAAAFIDKVWRMEGGIRWTPSAGSCAAWAPRRDWTRERFTMDEGLSVGRAQGLRPAPPSKA